MQVLFQGIRPQSRLNFGSVNAERDRMVQNSQEAIRKSFADAGLDADQVQFDTHHTTGYQSRSDIILSPKWVGRQERVAREALKKAGLKEEQRAMGRMTPAMKTVYIDYPNAIEYSIIFKA